MRRLATLVTAALVTAALLSGCGQAADPDGAPDAKRPPATAAVAPANAVAADGPRNDYDTLFLQMMISHQQQGREMLKLGREKGIREDVVNLAGAIDVTEAEEVETMRRWLSSWNVPVTDVADPGIHAAHGGKPATGPEEITALREATGADFETKFLNLLIAHQHNAVEMAQQQARNGRNETVKQFAGRIELSRTQQIKQMLALVSG
ncbi:DUF305 domain-containing protein [Dactylosporangium fulvum]|uniref:DUF305 domain-containing protein n=1 Tax=Dactylosporangium fulvum TaxID=53359 RepID=A0ABY5W9U4_9ACTN|nr:DUF305 domain-containing protein [Dactylosporangium fulvum]UWP84851.1 DUF305 domain-containing protein [Dactylosporangium fulvum]